jgi:hypothetical protein
MRELAARALARKAGLLALRERNEEAIVVADAAVERLAAATDGADAFAVAGAMLGEALAFFQEERFEEAVPIFDALVARFGESSDRRLRGIESTTHGPRSMT